MDFFWEKKLKCENFENYNNFSPNFIGGLNKPITIMAKDPNTGAMRPVTLYPKNVTKNPGGITTIQLAPNPSNIKIATPSPVITSPNASRLKPGLPILVPNADNRNLSPFSEDIASKLILQFS